MEPTHSVRDVAALIGVRYHARSRAAAGGVARHGHWLREVAPIVQRGTVGRSRSNKQLRRCAKVIKEGKVVAGKLRAGPLAEANLAGRNVLRAGLRHELDEGRSGERILTGACGRDPISLLRLLGDANKRKGIVVEGCKREANVKNPKAEPGRRQRAAVHGVDGIAAVVAKAVLQRGPRAASGEEDEHERSDP